MFLYLSGKESGGWPVVWLDSTGKTKPLLQAPGPYLMPSISPDGKRLAVSSDNDIWLYDLQRDTRSRFTFNQQTNRDPTWTPDGKHLVFSSLARGGSIWWIRADGSGQPQLLLETKKLVGSTSFTPDGRTLAYHQISLATGYDILTLVLDTRDRRPSQAGETGSFPANRPIRGRSRLVPRWPMAGVRFRRIREN